MPMRNTTLVCDEGRIELYADPVQIFHIEGNPRKYRWLLYYRIEGDKNTRQLACGPEIHDTPEQAIAAFFKTRKIMQKVSKLEFIKKETKCLIKDQM